jgi:4-hydroxyphenylpyruvate dioxygenase
MHFYRLVLGFQPIAYAGPETGVRNKTSYVVRQGAITLVLTSAIEEATAVADHVRKHGDGVGDIAFAVSDVRDVFETALSRGAAPSREPSISSDDDGQVTVAAVKTFGDTVHTFIERNSYQGAFLPGYRRLPPAMPDNNRLDELDHIAVAVPFGGTKKWSQFYQDVFEFGLLLEEYTTTEYSSMNSKVVRNPENGVTLVFVEPSSGKRKSPIDEYLRYYQGAGVHHLAFSSCDIIHSVRTLKSKGLEFTRTPTTYYDNLSERVGLIDEKLDELMELEILVDREIDGYLLQIFSQPVQGRPTFFYEIIQRAGARGFGNGNVKALFEAIERAQLLRGNT